MKKLFTVLMAIVLSFSTIVMSTACSSGGGGGNINENQTQLYVGLFKDGITDAWLQEAKADFEEKYKDVSFEEGKMGVQVVIDYSTGPFKPGTFQSNIKSLSNSLYFLDQDDYTSYAAGGLIRDMTAVLSTDVYDENGDMVDIGFNKSNNTLVIDSTNANTSMLDVMYEDCKTYFNRGGKYYGSPYLYIISGAIYDADYFNEEGLYFFQDGAGGVMSGATQADIDRGCSADGTLEISYGPDEIKGTTDDGMPATWDEFMMLINDMHGATPFVWSGLETYQRRYLYESVWANYQGYNDYMLLSKLEGTCSDGTVIGINNAVQELAAQEGRKAGIKALYDIMDKGTNGWTNYDEYIAQSKFVKSVDETERVAMLLDGGYWEVNMKGEFETMSKRDPNKGYGKRDFRLLPIPNFTNSNQGFSVQKVTQSPEVLLSSVPGLVCFAQDYKNKNDVQDRLAELFLYFTHSREQLIQFTQFTGGCIKPYHFEVTDADMSTLTKFGANIFSYINDGAKIATSFPLTDLAKKNYSTLHNEVNGSFMFRIAGSGAIIYTDPISYFKYNDSVQGLNASDAINKCFEDMKTSILDNCTLQAV